MSDFTAVPVTLSRRVCVSVYVTVCAPVSMCAHVFFFLFFVWFSPFVGVRLVTSHSAVRLFV